MLSRVQSLPSHGCDPGERELVLFREPLSSHDSRDKLELMVGAIFLKEKIHKLLIHLAVHQHIMHLHCSTITFMIIHDYAEFLFTHIRFHDLWT